MKLITKLANKVLIIIFHKIKEDMAPDSPGMRVLCPTWWMVRADSLASVIENYDILL